MNRSLLIFSLFIIIAGLALGLYIITFFGLLLLIPALVSPSRPPTRNAPSKPPQSQPWGRVIPRESSPHPPPKSMSEPVVPPSPPTASMVTPYSAPSYSPVQPISYTPALFPSPLLPSMSIMGSAPQPATMGSAPQPAKPPHETVHEGRDELIEVGAVLAILKLVFG